MPDKYKKKTFKNKDTSRETIVRYSKSSMIIEIMCVDIKGGKVCFGGEGCIKLDKKAARFLHDQITKFLKQQEE